MSLDIKFSWQGFENACWHREACRNIENTRWLSFDIKFTRQGFENAYWHRETCRAIQHAFIKPSLVNLISKDANLVFYLSIYPLLNTLQTSDYDISFDFFVDSASLATSFKHCNVIMTWLRQTTFIRQRATMHINMSWVNGNIVSITLEFNSWNRECSGSMVGRLTRDREAAGSSLIGVTVLCPWARHIYPSLVLVEPRKTRPYITERLLMGRKEIKSNK